MALAHPAAVLPPRTPCPHRSLVINGNLRKNLLPERIIAG